MMNDTPSTTSTAVLPSVFSENKDKLPPLSQSIQLEENQLPRKSRLSILSVSLMLGGFIAWAAVTPIEEVAVTQGQIIPTALIKSVQHLEGGIIKTLLVKEGDFVKENQLLLTLDGKSSESELGTLTIKEKSLKVRAERLRAFGLNSQPDFEIYRSELPQIVADQESVYKIQIKNREDQRAVVEKQLEQRKAQLAIQLGQEHDLREQMDVIKQERDVNKTLFEKRLLTGSKYRESEENLAKVRKDLNQVINQSQQTREEIGEKENELLKIDTVFRNEALKELGEVSSELSQTTEAKNKLFDRVERLDIKAPATGIIKGLKNNTLTGIIQPGAEIMQIVPIDALEVEAEVRPQDIGNVRPGQSVNVKISAYDYARFGGITGTLRAISASTFMKENTPNSQPYYKAYITLSQYYVGKNAEMNHISPGMTVQADIDTGKKTLLHYLIKPIYNAVDGAFREA